MTDTNMPGKFMVRQIQIEAYLIAEKVSVTNKEFILIKLLTSFNTLVLDSDDFFF